MAKQRMAVLAAVCTLYCGVSGAMAQEDLGLEHAAAVLSTGYELDLGDGSADVTIGCDRTDYTRGNGRLGTECFCGGGECGPPKLVARVGLVYMDRGKLDDTLLVTSFTNSFRAEMLDFDYEPGIDSSLSYRLNDAWTIDGRYLWLEHHQASEEVGFGPTPVIHTQPAALLNLFGTTDINFLYSARLRSAELNLRRDVLPWLSASAGFRYLELNEELVFEQDLILDGPRIRPRRVFQRDFILTRNDLYGLQLGADGVLFSRCGLQISGSVKSGLYNNHAEASVGVNQNLPRDEDDELAFVGEVGLNASYALSRMWSVRAGFQAMWLSGISVAGDQLPQTGIFFSSINQDVEGSVFYHGVQGGLEARW